MGSKRSYFTCNFFIFLEEDFALPQIQFLLLIFSKRLDNLLSVCEALDFIFSFGFAGLVFSGSMPSDLLPSPFSLLYFSISSRIVFFNTYPSLFYLLSFTLLSFCFQIENVRNLYFLHVFFTFHLHLSPLFYKKDYNI